MRLISTLTMLMIATSAVVAADLDWVRVSDDHRGFVLSESARPFTPWGFNYDHDRNGQLIEDYWDDQWPTVESAFDEMKRLGANVVRIHLQFGRFMESPTEPRQASLEQLSRLVKLAEQTGLYLDITGLGCYHKQDVPAWYDQLDEPQRWEAQRRFWEAVAATCATSPAIFCYDLMNEPVVAAGDRRRDDWLGPAFSGKHFVQFITLDRDGRVRHEIARQWIRMLVNAIRKHDQRHLVTVGLVPWSLARPGMTSGFDPVKIADELDFIAVHLYPEKGKLDDAIETLKGFAAVDKPVVIEEIFPLKCDTDDLSRFIDRSRDHATGWIGFYWGQTPDELRPAKTIPEAMTIHWLELFQAKTPEMIGTARPPTVADDGPVASGELLALTAESADQLANATKLGLMEVAPVDLPSANDGDCNHLGWPVATIVGDTMIVMHRRIPGHRAQGAGEPDPSMSYGIVLRSSDGGATWSEPYDLRDCMQATDRNRGGIVPLSHRAKFDPKNKSSLGYKVHLHSIGTTGDGAVVAINNHGVFRSDDRGTTWKHFSNALRDDTFPHPIINIGPRIVDHPDHGLMVFGNWFGEADSYHRLSDRFVVLSSPDGGATWRAEEHDVGFPQYEPAVLRHDERFLFVTRDQTKVRAHRQLEWQPGQTPVVTDTNLHDPRLVDTVDFCFNPITQRLEVVRSERHRMELWLWSIDPADWQSGQWRRECRLLARTGDFYSTADGFHPAGAVIDSERGVQHVFIYSGHPNGPAGVFRITRTLDTPKLSTALSHETAIDSPESLTEGGVVMTFDDRNFNDWINALPLLAEFDVKATFFISGPIDGPARDAIEQLKSGGHAIGAHSLHHRDAVKYVGENSPDAWIRNEIDPQLKEFETMGIQPSSFAYPMSKNNAVTDERLRKVFRHLRTGKSLAGGQQLCDDDAFFVPAAKIAQYGCLNGKGIDYAPTRPDRTFEQIDGALERAAENREIIVLYAHRISESGPGHFITPESLARVCRKAKELGLRFYTFDQLP